MEGKSWWKLRVGQTLRGGWGLESGKLYDATVDGWEESSEPIFLSNVQMTLRKLR